MDDSHQNTRSGTLASSHIIAKLVLVSTALSFVILAYLGMR